MSPFEIGLIFNQLVERRTLYTFTAPGRRRSQEEKQAVDLIEQQLGRLGDLDAFLATQGLKLKVVDADALGFANPGRIYVAVRDPLHPAPAHVGASNVLSELMDERRSDSADAAATWSTFFLLVLFYFLYTRGNRSIETVMGFREETVDLDEFMEEVTRRLEEIRSSADVEDAQTRRFRSVLISGSATTVEARAKSFFGNMVHFAVIEAIPDISTKRQVYRQTLWSAIDVAENFHRHAGALAVAGLDGVMQIALPERESAVQLSAE